MSLCLGGFDVHHSKRLETLDRTDDCLVGHLILLGGKSVEPSLDSSVGLLFTGLFFECPKDLRLKGAELESCSCWSSLRGF